MLTNLATIVLCSLTLVRAQTAQIDAANVADVKLVGAGGEVIDDAAYTASVGIQLTYRDAGEEIDVLPGVLLTRNQTAAEPSVQLSSSTDIAGKGYLICVVDPDAPTPQDKHEAQVKHWLAENLIAAAGQNGLYSLAPNPGAVTPYIGPGPGDGSDPHRYTVLVYEQPTPQVTAPRGEANAPFRQFDIAAYAAKIQGLKLVGATYFRVGPYGTVPNNDNYTPPIGGSGTSTTPGAPTGGSNTRTTTSGAPTGSQTPPPDAAGSLGVSALTLFGAVVAALF